MHKDSVVDPTGGAIITQDGNFSNTGSSSNIDIDSNVISSVTNFASATATASSQESMIDSVTKSNQPLAIKYEDFQFGDELRRGQFGSVYKAIWIEEHVAVKRLNKDMSTPSNHQHGSNILKLVQQRAIATKKNENDIDENDANDGNRPLSFYGFNGCVFGSIVYGLLANITQIDSTGAGGALIVIRL